jgi:hypothetical protein
MNKVFIAKKSMRYSIDTGFTSGIDDLIVSDMKTALYLRGIING